LVNNLINIIITYDKYSNVSYIFKPPTGGLYPLDEEGTYGELPRKPGMPPASPAPPLRERKPKIYSSYAVDSDCKKHGQAVSLFSSDHYQ
jgi:hypothetical protein